MAATKKATQTDAIKGGKVSHILVDVDPAEIAALTDGSVEVTLTGMGIKAGDLVLSAIPQEALTANLISNGAKVTAANKITFYLRNVHATNAVDGASKQFMVSVLHLS